MVFRIFPMLLCVAALAAADTVRVRAGEGAVFRNESGDAFLSLGGRMQLRHTYQQVEGAPDVNNFQTSRIRLALKGGTPAWDWEFQSDFANRNNVTLKDAFVSRRVTPDVSLRFGQFKAGYDRQQLESSGRQTFVDRNIASAALGKGRDLGVMLGGRAASRRLQYNVGVFNGGGEGQPNGGTGNMAVGRISLNPFGDFGLSQGDLKRSAEPRAFVDAAGYFSQDEAWRGEGDFGAALGAGFRMAGVYLAGEYLLRETSAGARSSGFHAQASYMLLPERLEIAARYAQVDPDADAGGDLRTESMGGVNVYFDRRGHNLKLNTDLALLKDEATGQEDLRTRAQFQIAF